MLLGPGGPGDTLSGVPWAAESPLANACFCQQAESARGFRQRWRATGQRAEAPCWPAGDPANEGGRGARERTALLGRGPGPGWVQSQVRAGRRIRVLAG